MKIIYNITTTAVKGGGMERVIVQKANYLADKFGHDITIITTDQKGLPTFYPFSEKIHHIDLGINYYDATTKYKWFVWNYILYRGALRKHHRSLERILIKEKADIIISMSRDEKEFLYKIKDGSKKILETHRCLKPRAKIEFKLTKNLLKRLRILYRLWHDSKTPEYYDKFIVLTEEDKEYWSEKNNVVVIPNPLPFYPLQAATLDNKCVLSVGRISIDKGIDRLISIWNLVSPSFSDWKLVLVGEVVDKKLLTQIDALHLQNSVEVHPPTPHIIEEYLNSSIHVMTSRFEAFGMVLIEAMACGVPNIAYSFKCGPKEIISDSKDGFLVEENDVETFVQKLKILMSNEPLRKEMGAKAKINSNRFSIEKVMQKWNDLFNELLI